MSGGNHVVSTNKVGVSRQRGIECWLAGCRYNCVRLVGKGPGVVVRCPICRSLLRWDRRDGWEIHTPRKKVDIDREKQAVGEEKQIEIEEG